MKKQEYIDKLAFYFSLQMEKSWANNKLKTSLTFYQYSVKSQEKVWITKEFLRMNIKEYEKLLEDIAEELLFKKF